METTPGFSQIRVYNGLPCNMTLSGTAGGGQPFGPVEVPSMGFWADTSFTTSGDPLNLKATGVNCGDATLAASLKDEKVREGEGEGEGRGGGPSLGPSLDRKTFANSPRRGG